MFFYTACPELRAEPRSARRHPNRVLDVQTSERFTRKGSFATSFFSTFKPLTFQPVNVLRSISFTSNQFRTLLHPRNSQLLSFQSVAHSLPKTPGVGGTSDFPFYFSSFQPAVTPSRLSLFSTTSNSGNLQLLYLLHVATVGRGMWGVSCHFPFSLFHFLVPISRWRRGGA